MTEINEITTKKYVAIKDGKSYMTNREYFKNGIYNGHDMNDFGFISIDIIPNINDLVNKKDFITYGEWLSKWRDKQINSILND